MLKNKKVIILLIIIIPVLFISINKYFSGNNFTPKKEISWHTYTDNKYHYSVDFPNYSNISNIYNQKVEVSKNAGGGSFIINGGVSFLDDNLGNFGIIRLEIFENIEFKNTSEWLNYENKRFNYPRKSFEKEILIDGYKAIVVHNMGGINKQTEEHFWNEKTAVLIKDGTLFEIYTRFGLGNEESSEHQKVWNSFKFLD